MSEATESKPDGGRNDLGRKDLVGPKRRGRNLAIMAALVAFVLLVYVVTIVKFDLATG